MTALAAARTVQDRTGMSLRRVLRTLRSLRSATVTLNGITQTLDPEIGTTEQAIIDHLNPPARH